MTTWYKTSSWRDEIEEIEVVKETEKFVTYVYDWHGKKSESRIAKRSDYNSCFPTREEAIKHLEERYSRDVENAEKALARASNARAQFCAKYNL